MTTERDKRIAEIRERHEKSTKGEWIKREHPDLGCFVQAPRANPDDPYDIEVLGEDVTLYPTRTEDVEFVACAHQDIPWLIDQLNKGPE